MYTREMVVRLYDTDAAGIIYFASSFRFSQDTFEQWLSTQDTGALKKILHDLEVFPVIRYAEADFKKPFFAGDRMKIQLTLVERTEHSFTLLFTLIHAETGQTHIQIKQVYSALNRKTNKKSPIPAVLKGYLNDLENPAR